jgi:hypothetical protein
VNVVHDSVTVGLASAAIVAVAALAALLAYLVLIGYA